MQPFCDGIIDIKFNANSVYCLKHLVWTTREIENQISKIVYNGNNLSKNTLVENSRFPPFILQFYKIIFFEEKIPSPEYFLEMYFNSFFDLIEDNTVRVKEIYLRKEFYNYSNATYSKEGIANRFYRTYPSLLRDFHFFILIKESNKFDSVSYSLNTDYFTGYDILVELNGKKFGISVFVKTRRGGSYKKKKQNRHDYTEYHEIELPINLNECRKIGNIFLLTEKHIDIILEKALNIAEES